MEFFPETEEYFYKANRGKSFRPECKYCFDYDQGIKKKQKKLQEEQDKWKEEYKDKTFTCTLCGEPKNFDQMRKDSKAKRVENRCLVCYRKKRSEVYNKNWESRVYAQVLKERRENNGTTTN
jgi:ribosomal protein S14